MQSERTDIDTGSSAEKEGMNPGKDFGSKMEGREAEIEGAVGGGDAHRNQAMCCLLSVQCLGHDDGQKSGGGRRADRGRVPRQS